MRSALAIPGIAWPKVPASLWLKVREREPEILAIGDKGEGAEGGVAVLDVEDGAEDIFQRSVRPDATLTMALAEGLELSVSRGSQSTW